MRAEEKGALRERENKLRERKYEANVISEQRQPLLIQFMGYYKNILTVIKLNWTN